MLRKEYPALMIYRLTRALTTLSQGPHSGLPEVCMAGESPIDKVTGRGLSGGYNANYMIRCHKFFTVPVSALMTQRPACINGLCFGQPSTIELRSVFLHCAQAVSETRHKWRL